MTPFTQLRAVKIWWQTGLRWDVCMYQSRQADQPLNWDVINPILIGFAFVCAVLIIFAQHMHITDRDRWVCTRGDYGAVKIKGIPQPAAPCLEETNVDTGEVRQTVWNERKVRK